MDKKRLALIHIIKKELGLPDDEYRRILREAAGVDSSKDLTEEGFSKLMRYFVRSGYYVLPQGLTIRQKMFIGHMQRELAWTDDHMANFLHKYYGGKREITALTNIEARKVIEALKHIQMHQKGVEHPPETHGTT